jgi:anthranilate synthase component 2
MKTLIIDNYDSFTYNLYQYLGELDAEPLVRRNDQVTLEDVRAMRPGRIVISPGPGSPDDPAYFGVCRDVILHLGPTTPLLGVCLGHQGICHAFGGSVVKAPLVVHGKTWRVEHDGVGIFAGLPNPMQAMRYHSLMGREEDLPAALFVTARTREGLIMGVQHRTHPIFGVQFHPESIGTPQGKQLLANFLAIAPPTPERARDVVGLAGDIAQVVR